MYSIETIAHFRYSRSLIISMISLMQCLQHSRWCNRRTKRSAWHTNWGDIFTTYIIPNGVPAIPEFLQCELKKGLCMLAYAHIVTTILHHCMFVVVGTQCNRTLILFMWFLVCVTTYHIFSSREHGL